MNIKTLGSIRQGASAVVKFLRKNLDLIVICVTIIALIGLCLRSCSAYKTVFGLLSFVIGSEVIVITSLLYGTIRHFQSRQNKGVAILATLVAAILVLLIAPQLATDVAALSLLR